MPVRNPQLGKPRQYWCNHYTKQMPVRNPQLVRYLVVLFHDYTKQMPVRNPQPLQPIKPFHTLLYQTNACPQSTTVELMYIAKELLYQTNACPQSTTSLHYYMKLSAQSFCIPIQRRKTYIFRMILNT